MTELVTGDKVAWVTKQGGKTCGVSAIHRVYAENRTYCSRDIPAAEFLFPPLKSLNICSRCKALCERAESRLDRQSA